VKGRLLAAQGRVTEALPYYEKATAANSETEHSIELARVYLAAGDPGRAAKAANEALRKSAGHPWAMAVLGDALVRDGQRASGLEYLNRALSIGPRRPAVWESLADGFEAAHDAAHAGFCRRQAAALR
jgi:predicted Zn-dependent protease